MGNEHALPAESRQALASEGLVWRRLYPWEKVEPCSTVKAMNKRRLIAAPPPLALPPGQRVDLLTKERSRLISEYDRARRIVRTGEMALLAAALRNVTNELMKRQLTAQGLIQ